MGPVGAAVGPIWGDGKGPISSARTGNAIIDIPGHTERLPYRLFFWDWGRRPIPQQAPELRAADTRRDRHRDDRAGAAQPRAKPAGCRRFKLRTTVPPRCASVHVAAAVADSVAEQRSKSPAKSRLLRCCGSTGRIGAAPAHPVRRPHFTETTARPSAPHPRHRTRSLRSSTLVGG